MRILIASLWAATQPSGICRTVISLVRGLSDIAPQMEVTVVLGRWQRDYFESSFAIGKTKARTMYIDIPNRPSARNWWYAFGLPKLARKTGADVLHLVFPSPVIRRLFKCSVVTTLHDLYPYDTPQNFGYPRVYLNRLALRGSLSACDRVACVSEFTLSRLHDIFPKISVKGSRIDNPIALGEMRTDEVLPIGEPFFLAVAQHRANKNLELLLRSIHLLKLIGRSDAPKKLVIVGMPGPETRRLHQLVDRLHLHESVVFLAGISDSQLAALYRTCEAFITLSRVEGFDLPLGEAIALGARALASDIPTHRSVGGNRCEYVRLGDEDVVKKIAEGLLRGKNQLTAPIPSIDQRHDIRRYAQQYRELYESVRYDATRSPIGATKTFSARGQL